MSLIMLMTFQAFVILGLICGGVVGKECTNIPTELSSHTFRYDYLNSHNKNHSHDNHLTPTDDAAWASLLPRKVLKEDEVGWMMMYRQMKNQVGRGKVSGSFLSEVALGDVRLDPESTHGQAQQTNLDYLLMLDVDSLVWSFRNTAGLPTVGTAYGGWESSDQELRGHFVGLCPSFNMASTIHHGCLDVCTWIDLCVL
ncbi:hypothetical protein HanXRQr2_Chr01g0031881 [Helianthus annuus]|uniref:Non-reducing end beta-L-arabinofuranosidase-like GH127 catalytic domain-containing protein n=1 Tax=Helianthus annuus TaxID=4232 RepID=A0A9K3JX84_HELAN|nr:hypothetical protein HanXRQr2_Chr01g0031881 [Helianthus annuus]